MIDGQPNACLSRVRLSEPLAGEQSAIETRSGGKPGETGEVGHILVVNDNGMVRQTITNYLQMCRQLPYRPGTIWATTSKRLILA
jgi:hypothetical protein